MGLSNCESRLRGYQSEPSGFQSGRKCSEPGLSGSQRDLKGHLVMMMTTMKITD